MTTKLLSLTSLVTLRSEYCHFTCFLRFIPFLSIYSLERTGACFMFYFFIIFLKVFAIQFWGECWSGTDAEKTYSEYGSSQNCWKGVGGTRTNFVYEFNDDKVCIITC